MREAGADRGAGQRRDGRLAHRDQRAGQQALALLQVGDLLVIGHFQFLLVAVGAHALDVAAGAEGGAGAGDQQRADVGILAAGLDHGAQRRRQIVRQRVADLGAVQRDDGDAVADRAQQFVGAGVDGDFGGHVSPHLLLFSVIAQAKATKQCPASRLRWQSDSGLDASHRPGMTAIAQNFSTQGRNSSSQVQALRGCCSTFQ